MDSRKPAQNVYKPLNREHKEIRLLLLEPARDHNATLRAELKHEPLQAAQFSALSYVWGQQEEHRSVLEVSYAQPREPGSPESLSSGKSQELKIGSNLAGALRCLRHRDEVVTLWVDAVCINQGDNDERSVQVAMMRDIYTRANKVCAWLGPSCYEDPDTVRSVELAFGVCREIWSVAQGVCIEREQSLDGEDHWLEACFACALLRFPVKHGDVPVSENRWNGFGHTIRLQLGQLFQDSDLLERMGYVAKLSRVAWFSRIWILQESGRARELQFYYGSVLETYKILLFGLCVARGLLAMGDAPLRSRLGNMDVRFRGCLNARATKTRSLPEVLALSCFGGDYAATDPRDQIYARLGLAESHEGFAVVHEKGWDVEGSNEKDLSESDRNERDERRQYITGRVFTSATRFLLEAGVTTTLSLFRRYDFGLPKLRQGCYPSWANDWLSTGFDTSNAYYNASAGSTKQLSFTGHTNGLAMNITGTSLSAVQRVGTRLSTLATAAGFHRREILRGDLQGTYYERQLLASEASTCSRAVSIQKAYHSLGLSISDDDLGRLCLESFPLSEFWHWWSSWIAQLEDLRRTPVPLFAGDQSPDSIVELTFHMFPRNGLRDRVAKTLGRRRAVRKRSARASVGRRGRGAKVLRREAASASQGWIESLDLGRCA